MTLGQRIRQVRKSANLSQQEVARRAGMGAAAAVSRLESDLVDPKASTLQRVAAALNVPVGWLFVEMTSVEVKSSRVGM